MTTTTIATRRARATPARRALVRWALRTARRDARQYTLILSMLAIAVATLTAASSAAYNLAPAAGRAEFGDADTIVFLTGSRGTLDDTLDDWLAGAADAFGTVDAIGHRAVAVPGATLSVDYRVADPDGTFTGPLLAIRSGRAPVDQHEVAVTGVVTGLDHSGIGDVVVLDGVERSVVGIVENPSDLDDEFVLLPRSELGSSTEVSALTRATEAELRAFDAGGPMRVTRRGDVPEDVVAGIMMLVAGTVLLALVGLVAAASFAVIAQRRLPQLGMLAAIGGTERHVRLSMVASGAITGIVGAAAGATVGAASWIALAPQLEPIVSHRIDRTDVPWWLIVVGALLAVVAATLAAWWPARHVSRIPIVMAIAGRTPRPGRSGRSAAWAAAVLAVGVVCLHAGTGFDHSGPDIGETLLIVGGTIGVLAGVLLVGPALIAAAGRMAAFAPTPARIALRELGRYQARSAAALAAIGLALGVPTVIVAATAAVQNAEPYGNVSDQALVVRTDEFLGPFLPDPSGLAAIATAVDELTQLLQPATVVRLDVVREPGAVDPGTDRVEALAVERRSDGGWDFVDMIYVARPDLLAALGIDADAVAAPGIATSATGDLHVGGMSDPSRPDRRIHEPVEGRGRLPATYTSLPSALVDPATADARGWQVTPSGRWLIGTDAPLTSTQIEAARSIAARHGVFVETREAGSNLPTVRLAAGLAGMLVAFGVLAATVGLMRAESVGEVRTLTAAGATRATRRGIVAATTWTLAALGAVLGVGSAYIGLAAGHVDHLTPLPWFDLALIAVATPLIASTAAWALGGREPTALGRRPLD